MRKGAVGKGGSSAMGKRRRTLGFASLNNASVKMKICFECSISYPISHLVKPFGSAENLPAETSK